MRAVVQDRAGACIYKGIDIQPPGPS